MGKADPACDLTVVILTFNEQLHIARAIESVRSFAREVIVVDSGSTDDTVAIAERLGARVLHHPFVNYARQFQWALDEGGITTGWIMRLDADEFIESDLADRLRAELPAMPADVAGVNFEHKRIFMGRWVRHGGCYPLVLLRMWRRGQGRIENRWMDEHIIVWGGRTILMKGGFAEDRLTDLTFFVAKHNSYATREAMDVLGRRYDLFDRAEVEMSSDAVSTQAAVKRWIKKHVYNRLPFWFGPAAYFLFRYLFQLGFLDGRTGLIYHVLQGFWYRFLVAAKVEEFDRIVSLGASREDKLARLATASGYSIDLLRETKL